MPDPVRRIVTAAYMYLAHQILERVFRKYMLPEDLSAQTAEES